MPRLGKTQTMLLMKLPQTKPETEVEKAKTLEAKTLGVLAQAAVQKAITKSRIFKIFQRKYSGAEQCKANREKASASARARPISA